MWQFMCKLVKVYCMFGLVLTFGLAGFMLKSFLRVGFPEGLTTRKLSQQLQDLWHLPLKQNTRLSFHHPRLIRYLIFYHFSPITFVSHSISHPTTLFCSHFPFSLHPICVFFSWKHHSLHLPHPLIFLSPFIAWSCFSLNKVFLFPVGREVGGTKRSS